ncbi:MAG: hypothetical protein ACRDAI_04870 [Candidatus Rhabdochlamydia sp.]
MTPCSPTYIEIDHTIDNTPVILDLSTRKRQELVSCTKRIASNCLSSSHFQSPSKKVSPQPSSSGTSNTMTCSTIRIPPQSKQEMTEGICRLVQKTNKPLEEIQIHYARALKADLQDIKNIYSAVSNKEQSANESSIIETHP